MKDPAAIASGRPSGSSGASLLCSTLSLLRATASMIGDVPARVGLPAIGAIDRRHPCLVSSETRTSVRPLVLRGTDRTTRNAVTTALY